MQARPNFILPLADASAELLQVGGKGASLARLAAAGLPVPDGFHILYDVDFMNPIPAEKPALMLDDDHGGWGRGERGSTAWT